MKRLAPLLFVLGLLVLAALVYYAGATGIGEALDDLGWDGFVIICLIHVPVLALLGSAWWNVARDINGARTWKFIWARYIRESAAEVLPFSQVGGVVIGARALTLSGMRMLPVAVSMLADLVIELAAKLPYIVVGLVLLFATVPKSGVIGPATLGVLAVGAAVALIVVYHHRIKGWLEELAIRMAERWPALGLGHGAQIRPAFDQLFARDWRIVMSWSLHLLSWGLGAIETWIMLRFMGAPVTVLEAVVIDSLVAAARTFGFAIPAAIGVQEGGYVLICGVFGIDPAVAIALSLVRRAREFALGLPGLGVWQAIEGKRAFAADQDVPPSHPDTLSRVACRSSHERD